MSTLAEPSCHSFAFINNDGVGMDSQREMLVSGYIRKIYDGEFEIPKDIISLFISYSKHSLQWRINHDKFITFQNKAEQSVDDWNYEVLPGPTFIVKGFEFECNIASVSRAEFIQFQIRLKSMDKYLNQSHGKDIHKNGDTESPNSDSPTSTNNGTNNIRSIVAYYEVCCDETKSSEKDTKILHEIGDEMSWPMYNMRVKECIHLTSFTFNVYVDIFKINHKKKSSKNKIRDIHYRPIKMYNRIKFGWNINGELLKQFKKSNFGKYWYSPNFGLDGDEINDKNFAWCLYCAPHGYNHSMNDKVYIGIVLLNLPPKIKKIEINFVMKCEIESDGVRKNIIEYEQVGKIMHYRDNCAAWPGSDKLKFKNLKKINDNGCMIISIQIDIIRVINDKGIDIDKNDWEYMGIMKKHLFPQPDISRSFSWLQYLHQK